MHSPCRKYALARSAIATYYRSKNQARPPLPCASIRSNSLWAIGTCFLLFVRFFDGAPLIRVPGRMYPVEVRYVPTAADNDIQEVGIYECGSMIWGEPDSLVTRSAFTRSCIVPICEVFVVVVVVVSGGGVGGGSVAVIWRCCSCCYCYCCCWWLLKSVTVVVVGVELTQSNDNSSRDRA